MTIEAPVSPVEVAERAASEPAARDPGHAPPSRPADSTFRPVFSLMSGRALAFVATFFIPVVLVRVFDQAEFGTYKQAFLIYSTLYSIAQFGMAESLFYFLPLAPQRAARYVVNSLLFLATAGLICWALLETTGSRISQGLSNPALRDLVSLIGAYLLLMMIATGLEIVLTARKRYGWAAWSYGVSDLLRAAFFILPAVVMRRLDWLLGGAAAFAALRVGAALCYFVREFGRELRSDTGLLKQQLAYAGPFGLAVLVEILQSNFHQYAVSYHFDAATFAIYAVGCIQPPFLDFVATPAGNVMMVRMSEEIRDGRTEAALATWHDTTRKLALLLVPLVGLQLVVAREIIVSLFTASYVASIPIFMAWSTAIVLSVVLTDGVLRVYAETRFLLLLNTIRLLLILVLIGPFLRAFGLLGAALVTIFATAVTKGVALSRMKGLLRIGLPEVLPWRKLGAITAVTAGAMVPAVILKSYLELSPLPLLGTVTVVYAVTYVGLLLGFGLVTDGERRTVTAWLLQLAPSAARRT